MRLVAALSNPTTESSCKLKPDMRQSWARKLKAASHPSHVVRKYERRSSKFGSYRDFTSEWFHNARLLPVEEFEDLLTTLLVSKKINHI